MRAACGRSFGGQPTARIGGRRGFKSKHPYRVLSRPKPGGRRGGSRTAQDSPQDTPNPRTWRGCPPVNLSYPGTRPLSTRSFDWPLMFQGGPSLATGCIYASVGKNQPERASALRAKKRRRTGQGGFFQRDATKELADCIQGSIRPSFHVGLSAGSVRGAGRRSAPLFF